MFYFEEIDGKKRKILLDGHMAPFGGMRRKTAFELGGELRKKEHWVPGNDKPEVQVTGRKRKPISVEGHLRDSLMGKGEAERARAEIESVWEAARPLRIVWNARFYIGQLDEAVFPVEDEGEFLYTLKFAIWTKGAPQNALRSPVKSLALSSNAVAIAGAAKAAYAGFSMESMDLGLASTLKELFAPLLSAQGTFLAYAASYEQELGDVFAAGVNLLGSIDVMLGRFQAVISFIEMVGLDTYDLVFADPLDVFVWRRQQAEALLAFDKAAASLWAMGESVESQLATDQGRDFEQLYVTSEGDTFERLAQRFETSFEQLVAMNPGAPVGTLPAGLTLRVQ